MKTTAYKAFTSTLCSPIQGGPPVWDGSLPHVLPEVELDTSKRICAAGWNACLDPVDTLKISGFWPDGRPIRLFQVSTDQPVIERDDKLRSSSWTITEELDVVPVIQEFSRRYFGDLAEELSAEQVAWHEALGRPHWDTQEVEAGLRVALETRGLGDWQLRQYESVEGVSDATKAAWIVWAACTTKVAWAACTTKVAWAAWDAWGAKAARAAWGAKAARAAWDARAAWGAKAAATWATRDAWAARDAAWATRDAWGAWGAWGALTVYYVAKRGWVDYDLRLLTNGIRRAYQYGLDYVVPTGERELGWVMEGVE